MDLFKLKIKKLKTPVDIRECLKRAEAETTEALETVRTILGSIKKDGDNALIGFIRKYDGYDADIKKIRVGKKFFKHSYIFFKIRTW